MEIPTSLSKKLEVELSEKSTKVFLLYETFIGVHLSTGEDVAIKLVNLTNHLFHSLGACFNKVPLVVLRGKAI